MRKISQLFDIDLHTLNRIKMRFPENKGSTLVFEEEPNKKAHRVISEKYNKESKHAQILLDEFKQQNGADKLEQLERKLRKNLPPPKVKPPPAVKRDEGMTLPDFIRVLHEETDIDFEKLLMISRDFDQLDMSKNVTKVDHHNQVFSDLEKRIDEVPGRITWEEFATWFQRQGTERQMTHDSQLYKRGTTRLYELQMNHGSNLSKLTKKMTEHRVQQMIPCPVLDKNFLFVVFDNSVANVYDLGEIDQDGLPLRVHQMNLKEAFVVDMRKQKPFTSVFKQDSLVKSSKTQEKSLEKQSQKSVDQYSVTREQGVSSISAISSSVARRRESRLSSQLKLYKIEEQTKAANNKFQFQKVSLKRAESRNTFKKHQRFASVGTVRPELTTIYATKGQETQKGTVYHKNLKLDPDKAHKIKFELKKKCQIDEIQETYGFGAVETSQVSEEQSQNIKRIINKIWTKHDIENAESLDRKQTKKLVKEVLDKLPIDTGKFSEEVFREVFTILDRDDLETIEKDDFVDFIKQMLDRQNSKRKLTGYLDFRRFILVLDFNNCELKANDIEELKKVVALKDGKVKYSEALQTIKIQVFTDFKNNEVYRTIQIAPQIERRLINRRATIQPNQILGVAKLDSKEVAQARNHEVVETKFGKFFDHNPEPIVHNENLKEYYRYGIPDDLWVTRDKMKKDVKSNGHTFQTINQTIEDLSLRANDIRKKIENPNMRLNRSIKGKKHHKVTINQQSNQDDVSSTGRSHQVAGLSKEIRDELNSEKPFAVKEPLSKIQRPRHESIDANIKQQRILRKLASPLPMPQLEYRHHDIKGPDGMVKPKFLHKELKRLEDEEDEKRLHLKDLMYPKRDANQIRKEMKKKQGYRMDQPTIFKKKLKQRIKRGNSPESNLSSSDDNYKKQDDHDINPIVKEEKKQDFFTFYAPGQEQRIKPGGKNDTDKDMQVLNITSCCFHKELNLLILCFIDRCIRCFKINGMKANAQVQELDIIEVPAVENEESERGINSCYKCPFIPLGCDADKHIINFKNILAVIGRDQLLFLSLDQHDFMVPIGKNNQGHQPKGNQFSFQMNQNPQPVELLEKRIQYVTGHQSKVEDLVTVLIYEQTVGIIIVFFNANFRVIDPIDFKNELWRHEEIDLKRSELREGEVTFTTAALSVKQGHLACGGLDGQLFKFDLNAKLRIHVDFEVHQGQEITDIFFIESQNQLISIGKDRAIVLWDSITNKEVQKIRVPAPVFAPDERFIRATFLRDKNRLIVADKRIHQFELETNEHVQLQQLTVKAIAERNKEDMLNMILNEAQKHKETYEGQHIINETMAELKGYQQKVDAYFLDALDKKLDHFSPKSADGERIWKYVEAGEIRRRPREFGKVILGHMSSLVQVANLDECDKNRSQPILYTIESDFMLRSWNLKDDGQCSESRLLDIAKLKPKEMSHAQIMRNLSSLQMQSMDYKKDKRMIQNKKRLAYIDICSVNGEKTPQMLALIDEFGQIQMNNFASGNVVADLSQNCREAAEEKRIKTLDLIKLHFVHFGLSTKVQFVASAMGGAIVFVMKPQIKGTISKAQVKIVEGLHTADADVIKSNDKVVAFGGQDNTVSFFKIESLQKVARIRMPGPKALSATAQEKLHKAKAKIQVARAFSKISGLDTEQNKPDKSLKTENEAAKSDPKQTGEKNVYVTDMCFVPQETFKGHLTGRTSYLMVLQNNGNIHILHPDYAAPVRQYELETKIFNGKLAMAQDVGSGFVFVVANEEGTLAKSYTTTRQMDPDLVENHRQTGKSAFLWRQKTNLTGAKIFHKKDEMNNALKETDYQFVQLAEWNPWESSQLPHPKGKAGEDYVNEKNKEEQAEALKSGGHMLTKILVSLRIIGKALLVHAMNDGEVNLYNARTGYFLHKMNTHMIFKYPRQAILSAIRDDMHPNDFPSREQTEQEDQGSMTGYESVSIKSF